MRWILALLCLAAAACTPTAFYTHTAGQRFASRGIECDFRITSTLPRGIAWDEIGVVNVQVVWGRYGPIAPATPAEFKSLIRKDVCLSGGEHVIGEVNGAGQYIRGTVFRRAPPAEGATQSPAAL